MGSFEDNDGFGEEEDYGGGNYSEGDYEYDANVPPEMLDRWKADEIGIERRKGNFMLLQKSMMLAKSCWFWRFYSLDRKLKLIYAAHNSLSELLNEEP